MPAAAFSSLAETEDVVTAVEMEAVAAEQAAAAVEVVAAVVAADVEGDNSLHF